MLIICASKANAEIVVYGRAIESDECRAMCRRLIAVNQWRVAEAYCGHSSQSWGDIEC
jgi:hypothetical protein